MANGDKVKKYSKISQRKKIQRSQSIENTFGTTELSTLILLNLVMLCYVIIEGYLKIFNEFYFVSYT